jgi:hypothetical protein
VDDDVDFARDCRGQRRGVVREEVVPSSPPLDARPCRQVEPEVGVGEEEYPDGVVSPRYVRDD